MTGSGENRVPYHVAVFIPGFDETTLDTLSSWDPLLELPVFPVRSEDGPEPLNVSLRRLRTSAQVLFSVSVEAVVGMRALRPNADLRWHHIGYWTENLVEDVAGLEAVGFRKEVWGPDVEGAPLFFAYMVAPSGLRVELTDSSGNAEWTERVAAERQAAVAADLAAGVEPARAEGRSFAHISAVVEEPVQVARSLEQALGISWNEPRDVTAQLHNTDGSKQTVTYQEIVAHGTPQIRLATGPLRDTLGNNEHGWDHVAFHSQNPDTDATTLEQHGYTRRATTHTPEPTILLSAPEGTRIKLTAAA
jgi:hypothetical protein